MVTVDIHIHREAVVTVAVLIKLWNDGYYVLQLVMIWV
jgi:hypothetical protein